jgi:acyl-CoA synthetase (AMP-forming)/AMP-acid ligase II
MTMPRTLTMKRFVLVALLATTLAGCVVVPAHTYYVRPITGVRVY